MNKFEIDAIVEIPKGSNVKYEMDDTNGNIYVDRILQSAYVYPYNYGFIPKTMSEDGDPIDVFILGDFGLYPGSRIKCRVIGGLNTFDGEIESGLKRDPKMILVPADKVDASFQGVKEIPQNVKMIIHDFVSNYKNNETGKQVTLGNWISKEDAILEIGSSIMINQM